MCFTAPRSRTFFESLKTQWIVSRTESEESRLLWKVSKAFSINSGRSVDIKSISFTAAETVENIQLGETFGIKEFRSN